MRAVIRKWGNSAALRLPSAVLRAARLGPDSPVDIREESGRIVITPLEEVEYDLDTLLAGVTEDNRHDAIDFGPPRGDEAL